MRTYYAAAVNAAGGAEIVRVDVSLSTAHGEEDAVRSALEDAGYAEPIVVFTDDEASYALQKDKATTL